MILLKWQYSETFTSFNCLLFTFSKKWNTALELWHNWLLSNWSRLLQFLQIVQKIPGNYCLCLYQSIDQVWWLNEFRFKRCIQKCTLFHRDVTDLVNNGMVKDTKPWIFWERDITFLRHKKVLNLCLRWHILKVYYFVVEVTFKKCNLCAWTRTTLDLLKYCHS